MRTKPILPSVRLVFDRKGQATDMFSKNAKTGLIQLEIYYNRTRKWLGTGIKVYKNQWSDSLQVINHPQGPEINAQLDLILSRARRCIGDRHEKRDVFDIQAIEKAISMVDCPYDKFTDAIQGFIDKKINDAVSRESSIINYKSAKINVERFGRIIGMSDVNLDNIIEFDMYMERQGKAYTTRREYHWKLSAVICWLKQQGWISENPYDTFKLKRPDPVETVRYLTDEECAKIEFHDFGDDVMNYVRDLFCFMRYTGMAFVDATKVNLDSIEIVDGKRIIVDHRKKTNVRFMVVVFEPAYQILKKYGQLNKYSISYVDQKLNIIGYMLLGKKVTTHMARHSFACWALKHGVPVPYIAKMLGHSNPETTLIYAEVIGSDVLEQSKKLEQAIAKKPTETAVVPMYG